jgi:hypothetical protein
MACSLAACAAIEKSSHTVQITDSASTVTGELTFSYRLVNWVEGGSSPTLTLSIAYHETMHRVDPVSQRLADTLPWSTNHEFIYTTSSDLAWQYKDLYLDRLRELVKPGN